MLSTPYVESSAALAEPAGPVPMIKTSVVMSGIRSSLAFHGDRPAAQDAADWEKLNIRAAGEKPPQAPRREQHHDDADQSKHEQIPGAIVCEHILQQKEYEHPDHRTLDGANSADHNDEDDVSRPIDDRERRVRGDAGLLNIDQRAGQTGEKPGGKIDERLQPARINADRARVFLVVAHGRKSQPLARAQKPV